MSECEAELADELAEIQSRWEISAAEIESRSIPLDQGDVTVAETVLVWVPT